MLALVFLMTLLPPVDGRVVREFAGGDDPFARGLRRAVVLSAAAGEPVRAPCAGIVRFAGATPRGSAVTLGCGELRVTAMGVRAGVERGARVRRGARLGVSAGNVGVSVRAPDGSYLAPTLRRPLSAPPPAVARPPAPRPAAPRGPLARPSPLRVALPGLPWPAWAGAALVLAAAAGRVRSMRVRSVRVRSVRVRSVRGPGVRVRGVGGRSVRGRAGAAVLRRSLSRQ